MKRRIESALLALAMLLGLCSPLGGLTWQARAAEETETAGETDNRWGDLTWEIREDTLYISGIGPMQEGEDVPVPVSLSDGEARDLGIRSKNLVYPWSNAEFSAVVIGEGVTSIAPRAFSGYSYSDSDTPVTFSISLPDSLESIGDYAFARSGDVVIGVVTLPAGLTSFGYFVFGDAPVWGIQVAEGNTAFSVEGDVLFNYDRTRLILYPDTPITFQYDDYTVPDTVKHIRGYAFAGCDLFSVTVSEGVTTIGEGAFSSTALRSITLPDSVTSIGRGAFQYSSRLTSLTLPAGLREVADGLCYDCSWLESVTLPSGITSIGEDAFGYCEALKSITLPDSVTSIGAGAFAYSGLTGLTLPDGLITVADRLCEGCGLLESVSFPDGITSIGDYAFYGCGKLPSAAPPLGVTTIGDYAFYRCTVLKTVSLAHGLTSIGDYAFGCCYALTELELPNSVTAIGDGIFSHCNALRSVRLSDSVTSIGDSAFSYCTALTAIELPNGVTSIDSAAFSSCTALTAISIPDSVTSIGGYAFSSCTSLREIRLPAGLRTIPTSMLSDCTALIAIEIPAGVTAIENAAFRDCTRLTTKVVLPAGVTKIGSRAFMNCIQLTGIEIPDGVTTIGGGAFAGCRALTAVQLPDSVTTITEDMGVQGYGAFHYCIGLKKINIPAGLRTIPDGTFRLCSALTEIVIPEGVTSIGSSAFDSCTALEKVVYGDTRARWAQIDIRDGNEDLTTALISCTDGYYGVEDPNLPGDNNYPTIQKVELTIRHDECGSFFYENLLPLYIANQTAEVRLSLENSWFDKNLNLMGFDSNGYIETFTGTVRICGYSGTAFKVLYEKQGTEVSDCRADNDATTSQLIFQMEASEYKEPFEADQLLFVEVLDQKGNILAFTTRRSLPIQRWSFINYDATIDEHMIKDILGDLKGTLFIWENRETPLGSDGLCFGMAVTASLFNSGELFPTMFQNCKVLDQVQKDTKVLTMNGVSTAQELIQKMHVIQHTEVVQDEMHQNYGDIDGLIRAIDNYKNGKCAMPMLSLKGQKSTHSICPYDYYIDDDNIAYFSCYDNCFPYRDCQLLVRLSNRSWELIGYDIDGYYGNSSTITYIVPSGFSGTKGKALMSAKSLGTLGTSGVKLVQIHCISNASDTDTTDTGTTDTGTGLYWISGSGEISASDLAGEAVSIADDYASYTVNSANAGSFALTDGEVDTVTATGDTVSLSCAYELADETGASTLVRVTFDGASASGSVSLSYDPTTDTVTLTGAGAGTLTVVYDDEDDTTADPSWTETVTGGEPTVSLTVTGGCQYDAATHAVTLNTVPQGAESVLIAAYADGQLLCVAPGAHGRTVLDTAARRADEIRLFYLDGDQRPVAKHSRIQIPRS